MKHYVLGFMFDFEKKNVLLIEKLSPEWQKGKLNGIGGKVEQGESPLLAMYREFEEETGMKDTALWKKFCTFGDGLDYRVWCFFSFGDITKAQQVEKERPVIYSSTDLPYEKMISNLKWLIPMAASGNIYEAHITERVHYD